MICFFVNDKVRRQIFEFVSQCAVLFKKNHTLFCVAVFDKRKHQKGNSLNSQPLGATINNAGVRAELFMTFPFTTYCRTNQQIHKTRIDRSKVRLLFNTGYG